MVSKENGENEKILHKYETKNSLTVFRYSSNWKLWREAL